MKRGGIRFPFNRLLIAKVLRAATEHIHYFSNGFIFFLQIRPRGLMKKILVSVAHTVSFWCNRARPCRVSRHCAASWRTTAPAAGQHPALPPQTARAALARRSTGTRAAAAVSSGCLSMPLAQDAAAARHIMLSREYREGRAVRSAQQGGRPLAAGRSSPPARCHAPPSTPRGGRRSPPTGSATVSAHVPQGNCRRLRVAPLAASSGPCFARGGWEHRRGRCAAARLGRKILFVVGRLCRRIWR